MTLNKTSAGTEAGRSSDWRNAHSAAALPLPEGYADQPYVSVLPDGSWLAAVTSASGGEGHASQGVFTLKSYDKGKSWSIPQRLENPDAPENSYAVTVVSSSGRIYIFYNFNTENIRSICAENDKTFHRVDSLGDYVFRYSDDGGHSWSPRRYPVPVREFQCDRNNVYAGSIRFFWSVGKPCYCANGDVVLTLHKVGAMGEGFFAQSEGAFLRSPNLMTESDPEKLVFHTLPDGDVGLQAPAGGGRIAEEHSVVELGDGGLYTVYRGVDGHPICSISRDGGRHWTPPTYKRRRPGGRLLKNPRAANFVWKLSGGRYLYWFHNHGGRFIRALSGHSSLPNGLSPVQGRSPYDDRNPAWVCAGWETDGPSGRELVWSEPEILLYEDDPLVRMSYPDLVEDDGGIWITETNKAVARLHRIPQEFLDAVFASLDVRKRLTPADLEGIDIFPLEKRKRPEKAAFPQLPPFSVRDHTSATHKSFNQRTGFSLFLEIAGGPPAGTILLDTRQPDRSGVVIQIRESGVLRVELGDGQTVNSWDSDLESLQGTRAHRIALIVDGGPRLILFVINGELQDGGDMRQFGWGRFSPNLRSANGASEARLDPGVLSASVFLRPLLVAEAGMLTRPSAHQPASAP